MSFVLITDSGSDLNPKYFEENSLPMPLEIVYTIDGKTTGQVPREDSEYHDFYEKMRHGAKPFTSMVNSELAKEKFETYLKKGEDVLYIGFSSALSGTYGSGVLAQKELAPLYPERKIYCIDSLCASRGQGLLFNKCVEMKNAGKTIDEIKDWVENNRLKLCHNFTVDDLVYLQRGGRVSRLAAFGAGLLDIKPVMHVSNEGKLTPVSKVRKRKKSIAALVENMVQLTEGVENDTVYICHGDCIEDAEYLKSLVTERTGVTNVVIDNCGVAIGSHAGPGVLALFFMGNKR